MNPLTNNVGMSDPHARVFGDKLYLYCGHDDNPDVRVHEMKDWMIYTSSDLVTWTKEGVISPADNYMGKDNPDCWASDAIERNGKYYFYFSDGKRGIGVMASDSPAGPFVDVLGGPLVEPMHDPTILVDDDVKKTPYLVYGEKSGIYQIVRLNDDMVSLAESPRPIEIIGEAWENAPDWMDKNYLFKHKNTYYLSWGREYAISDNVYGPYECVGQLGTGHELNELAHGSFFTWNGQFYHIWCFYLREGYKYRESILTYCHIGDDGKVTTDTDYLDEHYSIGVGQYDSAWSEIRAEWFYDKSLSVHKQGTSENGFSVVCTEADGWVKYANVQFEQCPVKFVASVGATGQGGAIEIYLDSLSEQIVGTILVSDTECEQFKTVSCELLDIVGRRDLFIRFRVKDDSSSISLSRFNFLER